MDTQVTKQLLTRVTANNEVMPHVHLMTLDISGAGLEAKPGQFVMVRCGEDVALRRPLSIHEYQQGKLSLLFNVLGRGTEWLAERKTGDALDIIGPLGNGYTFVPKSRLLLVAGGIGIAPLYFLAQQALAQGCTVKLLLGAATASQLYPQRYLPDEIEVAMATDDGSAGQKAFVTHLLPVFVDWSDQVFACGPVLMYHDMYLHKDQWLKDKPVQVSLEVVMGCGRGFCYGCTVKTKKGLSRVCQEGPVFNLDDIIWSEFGCEA